MTIEQKAKAYDAAIERAKEFQKSKTGACVLIAESIFPEIKENASERVRKYMIDCLRQRTNETEEETHAVEKWIDFLEEYRVTEAKACEPIEENPYIAAIEDEGDRPAELIQKFVVGDIIRPKAYNEHHIITNIRDGLYVLDNGFKFPIKDQDVWVFATENPILTENKAHYFNTEWNCEDDQNLGACLYRINDEYLSEWLKSHICYNIDLIWNEKDDDMALAINQLIKDANNQNGWNCVYPRRDGKEYLFTDIIKWVESLKNRYVPQLKQKWTDEDNEMLEAIIYHLRKSVNNGKENITGGELEAWLKTHCSQMPPMPNKLDIEVLESIDDEQYILKINDNVVRGVPNGRMAVVYKNSVYSNELTL